MLARILALVSILAVYLYIAGLYFLFSEGVYTFCNGSSATWSDEACDLVRSDTFIVSSFLLLLMLAISNCYIVLASLKHLDITKRFLLHVSLPLVLINILGFFAPLRFCLGFLGCSEVYYWPLTVPYSLGILAGFWIFVTCFNSGDRDSGKPEY